MDFSLKEDQNRSVVGQNRSESAEESELTSRSQRVFRTIRNELAFEVVFVLICCILAIGLNIKVTIAVVLLCLKFAIPDFVTAYLVFQHDPSRSNGLALAFLFMATGMARACQFALIALLTLGCVVVPFLGPIGVGNLAAIGMLTGFVCTFVFLACVFPLTFLAYVVSVLSGNKYLFAAGLTKLRRSSTEKKSSIELKPEISIRKLGVASGISLSVCLISSLFLIPFWVNIGPEILLLVVAVFVSPFFWIKILESRSLS